MEHKPTISYGYFCIGFIYFMLKGKGLLDNKLPFIPLEEP